MSILRTLLSVTFVAVMVTGCVVEERSTLARPSRACAGGVWVDGHYGPHGGWYPGHWRCPDVAEVVEVN